MSVWGRILVKPPGPLDVGELNRWRRDLLNTFNPDDFGSDGPLREVGFRDLDLVPINQGVIWLELGLWLDYYDIGSEYADPTPFVAYADWLEAHIPGCRVYYGHENSDERIQPFDPARRAALMDHYRRFGNEPYLQQRRAWAAERQSKADRPQAEETPPYARSPTRVIPFSAGEAAEFSWTILAIASPGDTSIEPSILAMLEQAGGEEDQAIGPNSSSSSSTSGS